MHLKLSDNWKKYLILFFFGCFIWFLVHSILTVADGLNDHIQPADAAVIFGNEVLPDGSLSDRLKARLDKGLEIYRQGYTKTIIVSGGTGKSGFDEADMMKKYLTENGIPETAIIPDHNGINTCETAKNVAGLQNRPQSVILVSQYFHLSRAKLAFSKFGFKQIFSAHANYFEPRDLFSLCREFFGYYAYLIRSN